MEENGAGTWPGVGQTLSSIHSLNLWDRILHVALGKHNIRRWEATQQVVRVAMEAQHLMSTLPLKRAAIRQLQPLTASLSCFFFCGLELN